MNRLLAAAAIAASVSIRVGAEPASPLVSQDWLAAHLHDADLVVLHVGTAATYEHGHIPGARFADWTSLRAVSADDKALTLEMPPPGQLRAALESMGVSDSSHVVVYASDGYWSPSARVVMTLEYAGLKNVSYLDGGLKAWTAAGKPLSTEVPAPRKGTLAPLAIAPIIVDAAFVQSHIHAPGVAIVDARARPFYDGQKSGHIPGALSAPFDAFAAGDGQLKPASEIKALFDEAGVKPTDTVIGYCHIGQQATAMLFAARTLGHRVLLYDGSFEDWARRNLPVEPAAGRR